MKAVLLEVRGVSVRFAGVEALRAVSLDVPAGSVVGLIGPNGAGKTTLIDAVAGFVPLAAGTVAFDGTPLDGLAPHRRARLGMARTFQSLELFEDLSVGENLLVAADAGTHPDRAHPADGERRAGAAARALGLGHLADRLPTSLSQAERARLAMGRAAAGEPRLLLLDEPAAGLDAEERTALGGRIRQLAEGGLAIVLVDHDVRFVLALCDEVVVLDLGEVIAHGPPSEVRADRGVAAAYLGQPGSLRGREPPGPAGPKPEGVAPEERRSPPGPRPSTSPVVLDVRQLTTGYGGVPVVHDLDLQVRAGEVVALLGSNGAGKTTTLRAISGTLPVLSGRVVVLGQPVDGRADRLARRGLAYVPQGRALFPGLSVREHLRLARRRGDPDVEDVVRLFPSLEGLLDRAAGRLSGGEQQLLALARALAGPHRLLVVDEMSLGLAPPLVELLLATLRRLAVEEGAGVLVVEQHVGLALALADRAYVVQAGRVVLEGPASVLAGAPALVESSYLGAPLAEPPPA